MACEKEIHILRRELEATKKRYQDLKDEKETLVDQQVSSTGEHHLCNSHVTILQNLGTIIQSVVFQLAATTSRNFICSGSW